MNGFVAFDLDGVLYSAEPFLGEAYREAIGNVNMHRPGAFAHVPTTSEILAHVGWPVPVILKRLFPDADAEAIRLVYEETLEVICRYVARARGTVFPAVSETLRRLREAGLALGVASNGRHRYIECVLQTHALEQYFVAPLFIDGGQGVSNKAGIVRTYMERYRVTAPQTVMVGDRESDVQAAVDVGCLFVGCDYGHGHRNEIEGAGPIVSSFADLATVVPDLLGHSRIREGGTVAGRHT